MWSLDAAGTMKVMRYGFNLVPDFGGTAHAYCGSTLDACIGDLLSWSQMPRREDALKAYIIKSRVRKAERLILAQPYSPHLFRQGVLPGPDLLLRVLTKSITWEEAAKLWKNEEKKRDKREAQARILARGICAWSCPVVDALTRTEPGRCANLLVPLLHSPVSTISGRRFWRKGRT